LHPPPAIFFVEIPTLLKSPTRHIALFSLFEQVSSMALQKKGIVHAIGVAKVPLAFFAKPSANLATVRDR
jgi:hypothetical protein